MSRRIEWTPAAQGDIGRLDRRMQERIRQALYRLADTGYGDVKRIHGTDQELRLRVGNWRVRFIFEGTEILRVLRVLPRSRAYRD